VLENRSRSLLIFPILLWSSLILAIIWTMSRLQPQWETLLLWEHYNKRYV